MNDVPKITNGLRKKAVKTANPTIMITIITQ